MCSSLQGASSILKDRLYQAQGLNSSPHPEFPFTPVDIRPPPATPTQATPSAVMPVSKGVTARNAPSNQIDHNLFAGGRTPLGTGRGGFTGYVSPMGSQGSFVGQAMGSPIPTAVS